jgi:hypothetical protein
VCPVASTTPIGKDDVQGPRAARAGRPCAAAIPDLFCSEVQADRLIAQAEITEELAAQRTSPEEVLETLDRNVHERPCCSHWRLGRTRAIRTSGQAAVATLVRLTFAAEVERAQMQPRALPTRSRLNDQNRALVGGRPQTG